LQKQCVTWFRAQYPQYAMLLTHPINEGGKNTRITGAIHKGEGTVAGVPDLLLFIGSEYKFPTSGNLEMVVVFNGLGIEMKTKSGKQTQEQKDFQKMFESASFKYVIVRSLDEFIAVINEYISNSDPFRRRAIAAAHVEIEEARRQKELEHFKKVIGKK